MELEFILVGIIWGVTNPFIKRASFGLGNVRKNNTFSQILSDALFLGSNLKFVIPFVLANCGSLLYFFTLHRADLTVAVPLTNSVTFLFTSLSGWLLGEQKPGASTLLGMVFVLAGISSFVLHSH